MGKHRSTYGKTYEEIYGWEKAKELRRIRSEKIKGENNPAFIQPNYWKGKKRGSHSKEHNEKISRSMMGKHSGENNPMFGRSGEDSPNYGKPGYWRDKIRPNMSERMGGENNPMFGKTGELSPVFGRIGDKHPLFGVRGEMSATWKGGVSFEPYTPEFNGELKEKIRSKFGYRCALCGKTEKENGRKLTCHHIDYNKKNNLEENFVPLCISCNSKVNSNRDQYEIGFKIFMTGSAQTYEEVKENVQ